MSEKNKAVIFSLNLWKTLICLLVFVLFWSGCPEKPRIYRVGVLDGFPPFAAVVDGFKSEMAELGYKEGENIFYDVPEVGLDPDDHRRIIGKFVADKIFKGTPAGSIPVVTPEAYLAFNYKLALQLGLTVPDSLLRMAKEIIR